MIVKNEIIDITFDKTNNCYKYHIDPGHLKHTISLVTNDNVLVFSAIRDYSFENDYYSEIKPPKYVSQIGSIRKIQLDGKNVEIHTSDIKGLGIVEIEKELYEISTRQCLMENEFKKENYYFGSFSQGEQKSALESVREILNKDSILWDLKEVWIVDPYLSAIDILQTGIHCKKYGVKLNCLTCIKSLTSNQETVPTNEIDCNSKFSQVKKIYREELENSIIQADDIKIEFRTVSGNCGEKFHDRYILKVYEINRCRAWSLGISINSLGKSHHTIQIVESPNEILKAIHDIWDELNNEECIIYKK